jgi:hypothetical protein
MGVSGQHHAPGALYPGDRTPSTHRTGGSVDPEPVWTQKLEEKSLAPEGSNLVLPVIQPTASHYTD